MTTPATATRRWIVAAAAAGLVAAAGVGAAVVAVPIARMATAYKAKTLCSEVFVAGRPPADAVREMEVDDLRALRAIGTTIDTARGVVTARALGLIERRARARGDEGCAVERGGVLSNSDTTRRPRVAPAGDAADTVAALAPEARRAIEAVLDDAFAEPDPDRARRTRAVVVVRGGRVVAERYARGVDATTRMPGWSLAKSVLSALVGIAAAEGRLAVDAPPRLRAWSAPGDPRGRITVRHLLHMSSGLGFDEDPGDPRSDALRMLFAEADMAAFAAAAALDTVPGARWRYSTGTSMILSRALREALGDSAYRDFPRRALFDRVGMASAVLETDASGTFVASSYLYATARDWARFGTLYLRDGVWGGARVLPEGWVAFTRRAAPAAPDSTYGAHFWLATPREYRGPPAPVPTDAYHAVGHQGQFVTIVPSHDVVIVRLGRTRHPSAWPHDRFVAAVLAALSSRAERP